MDYLAAENFPISSLFQELFSSSWAAVLFNCVHIELSCDFAVSAALWQYSNAIYVLVLAIYLYPFRCPSIYTSFCHFSSSLYNWWIRCGSGSETNCQCFFLCLGVSCLPSLSMWQHHSLCKWYQRWMIGVIGDVTLGLLVTFSLITA